MSVYDVKQSSGAVHVSFKVPDSRYFNEAMRMKCFVDLLKFGAFPNAKELTETMAAYNAVRKHIWGTQFRIDQGDVDVVVVGDGSTPRTGAVFAMMSRWRVFSIDPALKGRELGWESKVKRLSVIGCNIEEAQPIKLQENVILVAVHSHANMANSIDWVRRSHRISGLDDGSIAVVAMPCCTNLEVKGRRPNWDYQDWGCWSPKRRVMVYLGVETGTRLIDTEN